MADTVCTFHTYYCVEVRAGDPVEVEQRPGRGGGGPAAPQPRAPRARLPLRTHAFQVLILFSQAEESLLTKL